ncbi:3-isopropylmalate dehydratase large subunit [Egicoccus halophilus]|uniref:3-isopropylmalate dehydratase large subunit n=1 Tax=Egicoccus halophilus TaxID=1670830 RepID=A0A8J3EUP1_9ACTN|nr:3-isopropylmalate dehydratase large subunit [Egicoccus halophilus]GGI06304.1 3-isopropylmalate dehydratase large subunit [Egicoccus halophilus]
MSTPRTIVEKIWDQHVVRSAEGQPDLLYVDLHLVHEVTSPQAFDGLRVNGRSVRRPDLTLATADHNVPTDPRQVRGELPLEDELSAAQLEALRRNCDEFGIRLFPMGSRNQGIVHIIGPELGLTQPGAVIVCGDSHTATHGAFGALAFGIGTSEVEHVLATQTLPQRLPSTLAIEVDGVLPAGTTPKDLILHILGVIGVDGGTGHVIEYRGRAFEEMSMEGRMTVCNMSIEGGARAGLVAPDETTFAYLKDKPYAPQGDDWDAAVAAWRELRTDEGATFDRVVHIDAADVVPTVTWGTTPAQSVPVTGSVPRVTDAPDESTAKQWQRALDYMGLVGGEVMTDIEVDTVFIGSCTNGRLEDLRAVAEIVAGQRVRDGIRAMVVPGSGLVQAAAEAEGIADVLIEAGFDWRSPGCSMCLGMNPDQLAPGERAASTSNRNFEGRQGFKGRTHLVSPAMAAAAALTGRLADVRQLVTQEATV